ncbi:hypothetical protein E7744_11355 [Citricoccus sp. SGAir0253]|uniref:hypothetical protein n=1 Tax=Citricoccus sp. SGAir0253 TaxID=2567881 RepID=UPI0010CCDAAD|nr:hypothetical protein [Citricoccus sp. SGAir0253]QCU78677.1 hypothetical protein E7744_11355 [Citricoccus sp. SGAir0253]
MVSANWKHLGHREHRLLTFMALVSLDTDRPPIYFGGWQAGAEHLGLDPVVNPDSAAESFRQAISKLKRAGAVVPNGVARQGNRAEYALALNPALTAVPTITRNGTGRPVTTWSVVHRQDPRLHASPNEALPLSPNDPLGHQPQRSIGVSPNGSLPPRRTEEPLQEYRQEEGVESQPPSPAPVENSGARTAEGIDAEVYAAASAYLQARPMQHLTLMELAAAELGPDCSVRRQVITAAQLAGWRPREAAA